MYYPDSRYNEDMIPIEISPRCIIVVFASALNYTLSLFKFVFCSVQLIINSRRSLFVTLAIRVGQASNQMRWLSCSSLLVIRLNLNAGSKKRGLSVSQVGE